MNKLPVFRMHSSCIAVKGANRSSICDLQRNEVKLIPHDVYDLITLHEGKTIDEIKKQYDEQYHEIVDEYLTFLFDYEYAFLTDNPKFYPKLNTQWFESSEVTNAIIDISEGSTYDVRSILSQLDKLNCKYVQIRFFSTITQNRIIAIVDFLNRTESMVSSLNFVISNTKELNIEQLTQLLTLQPRISSFILYNAEKNDFINPLQGDTSRYIQFTTKNITSSTHCGVITQEFSLLM